MHSQPSQGSPDSIKSQEPPAWTLRCERSHGGERAVTWITEAYIPNIDGYIDTTPAGQYGIAVGDLLLMAGDPPSLAEALAKKTVAIARCCHRIIWVLAV